MTTQRQIEEACENIGRDMAAFRADPDRVAELQRCLTAIGWLREQYRLDKAALEPFMDRLKDLSRQTQQALSDARETLTTKYLEAVGALTAWEDVREACRLALIELSVAQNIGRFDSPQGSVEVKQATSISLPKTGTVQREQLCEIITSAGRWSEVALPNASRLLKAVEENLFSQEQAREISRLCPTQIIYRVAGHAR
jgi:hypothetical protein